MITNPILPGFHPDPSIVRVGRDYYIATSTFHWCRGVRIHHSRDLVHWRLVGHALTRRSQFSVLVGVVAVALLLFAAPAPMLFLAFNGYCLFGVGQLIRTRVRARSRERAQEVGHP